MRLDFCIIGAMKSATTTLYALLVQHPDIVMAERHTKDCIGKEPGYFSRDERFALGEEWYFKHFRMVEGAIVGEGSTCYSRRVPFPNAAPRLASFAPDVKLIYVLRNPAERAIAHYKHEMRRYFSAGRSIPDFYSYCKIDPAVLSASEYDLEIEHLMRWFSRDQLKLLRFEDLVYNQKNTLAEVQKWLGVDSVSIDLKWANDSVNALRDQVVRKRMSTVTTHPFVKALGKPFAKPFKRRAKAVLRHHIASDYRIENEIQKFEKSLIVPIGSEYEVLIDRYRDTVGFIENWTGWDLAEWKGQQAIK